MLGFCFSTRGAKPFIDPTIDGAPSMHIPTHKSHDKPCFSRLSIYQKMFRLLAVVGNFFAAQKLINYNIIINETYKYNHLCMVIDILIFVEQKLILKIGYYAFLDIF